MIVRTPDEYRDAWKDYRSRGPVAPLNALFHRQPDPEFAALCAEAEECGLQVMLDVSAEPRGTEATRHRLLGPIVIGIPERPQLITETIGRDGFGKSLHEASRDARTQLAAIRSRRHPDQGTTDA